MTTSTVLVAWCIVVCQDHAAAQATSQMAKPVRQWRWDATAEPLALVGGRVFDGSGFAARPIYVDGGKIVRARPTGAREIDLTGRYLTPAFADAHVHRFSSRWDAAESREMYFRHGFLYAMNCGSSKAARSECEAYINRPTGVDLLYANGGFTAAGGHPVKLNETLHRRHGGDPATFFEQCADDRFYIIRSSSDITEKAELHALTRPDLLKLFLLHSDEFSLRAADEQYYGRRGLDPALVPLITREGHRRGLRVGAHVESAADLRTAVHARVDFVLHTPGYNIGSSSGDVARFLLTPTDAQLVARNGTFHTTTVSWVRTETALDTVRRNLSVLKAAGVRVIFGSDDHSNGPTREIRLLRALGVYSGIELLTMLCHDTPRALYPDRRIGRLDTGYEANLLVFAADPLRDPGQLIEGPVGVIKQGAVLSMGE